MKRLFDILFAGSALLILSPVLLITALLVACNLGSPILFSQRRPGLHAQPFRLLKFRSMLDTTDYCGRPLSDSDRMTPFGRFLRSSSLDELPGLWNVLKGDMSLVGPRPLLMGYLALYTPTQARRHETRPGITGWAQVNGRNAISWEEKFTLDVWYVDHRSFLLDLNILSKTILLLLRPRGISASGEATMHAFVGSQADAKKEEPGHASHPGVEL